MNRNTTIYFLLFTLLFLNSLNAQTTLIPDQNFEQYLIDIGIDSDATINGQVLTSDISGIFTLDIKDYNISNFEGLQFFTSLTEFNLTSDFASSIPNINFEQNAQLSRISILEVPNLSQINVSQNISLTSLLLVTLGSSFSSIDVSKNVNLTFLSLGNIGLMDLNLENNLELTSLGLDASSITFLDVSKNKKLTSIIYRNGSLENVNLKNGFNNILSTVILTGNPDLSCIQVDIVANAEAAAGWSKDDTANYVDDAGAPPSAGEDGSFLTCGGGGIEDLFFELGGNPDEGGTWFPEQLDGAGTYTYTVSKACYPNSTAIITVDFIPDPDAGEDGEFLFESPGSQNLNDLRNGSSKLLSKSILAGSGKWFGDLGITEDGDVDFPNTGAGAAVAYSFTFQVENDCGVLDEAEITVEVEGFDVTEELEISICENVAVTIDFLNDALDKTVFGSSGTWEADTTINFGDAGTYFYVNNRQDDDGFSTVIVGVKPDPNAGSSDQLLSESGPQNLSMLRNDNSNIMADAGKWTSLEIEVTEDGDVNFPNTENEYIFTYTTNANECGVVSSVDVVVKISAVLSVDHFLFNEIVLFPNPTKETLYINGDLSRIKNIEIYSITGQHIMTVNKNLKELNLSILEPSLYFMRLNTENATKIIKVIKI